ncbi:SPARC-related modular calcium-binding protein 2-like isoform X3 [Mya arenaria]|uniref:SPARC-related modular calcium-binding protein 2-like isoform X3 n=1 Tax=Mya arenaria TaxID=6604 RepID=UPI0022E27AAA|nr:SPARC-related modular calcium-binding protein 2-like isoform X3 [Mya arenaria]
MYPRAWLCVLAMSWIAVPMASANSLSVSEIQATGKVLFRALRDSEELCKVRCKSRKSRIMCGSDGTSYLSKCELKRARRCEGKKVTIVKKGKCADEDVPVTKCFQEKEEALRSVADGAENVFIPECNTDGTFREVQCHSASGFCWCVSEEGKPFPRTSTKDGQPNCKAKDKTDNRPKTKSRVRRKKGKKNRKSDKRKSSKRCTNKEKSRFNSNLVRVFTEEYDRAIRNVLSTVPDTKDPLMDTLEKQVVEWKFSQYDSNGDNLLQIKEVNGLKRLVKKFIKPRSCAKRFLKFCDPDKNKLIERQEWSICLGVDINNEEGKRTTTPPSDAQSSGESLDLHSFLNKNPSRDKSPSSSSPSSKTHKGEKERQPPPSLPALSLGDAWTDFSRPREDVKAEKHVSDCRTEREGALEQDHDNPDAGIFVPTCTPEGTWAHAQCHNSTGYCWCVDENTGRPIVGTSTHGVRPDCDFVKEREIQARIPVGCTYAEKQTFVADLVAEISKEMKEYALNPSTDHSLLVTEPNMSLQERSARGRFNTLDGNKNKVIDDGEAEEFRATTIKNAQQKQTRKCARKFVRYCDENEDSQISVDEWVDCLGITRTVNVNLPSNPKRIGVNPFDTYLRDN